MRKIILILSLLIGTIACTKNKVKVFAPIDTNCTDTISYIQDLRPILDVNCTTSGCHDAVTQAAGFKYVDYNDVSAEIDKIITFSASDSPNPMPIGLPVLADSILKKFRCWKSQGSKNN